MRVAALGAVGLGTATGGPVRAQESPVQLVCPNEGPALPAPLSSWADRTELRAGGDVSHLGSAHLVPGKAIDATLAPTPKVHYVLRPEKPGGSVSFGGLYALTVTQPGTYRVALGTAAWIDLVRDGKAVPSKAHGHGPECSGIRKMVDFTLTPGSYVLQISANASPDMPLLVARLP